MNNLNQYPADDNQKELYKKFPSTHYLSNPMNVIHSLAWCTFWRRNMHRFVRDYLKLSLYVYQELAIYLMGISNFICIIASRNDAKSFIIALYACCRCILYPGTKFRIGSATKKQAKLIVSDKILDELCEWSKPLKAEIADWSTSENNIFVKFKNGSKITVFVANDNARGLRSNAICREEFRQIDKKIEDSVISPFQTVRNQPYMLNSYYGENPVLQEDPVDVYISSSWIDNGAWIWDIVDQAYTGMQKHNGSVLLTFDETTISGGYAVDYRKAALGDMSDENTLQDQVRVQIRNKAALYVMRTVYNALKNATGVKYVFEGAGLTKTGVDKVISDVRRFGKPTVAGDYALISQFNAFAGYQGTTPTVTGISEAVMKEIHDTGLMGMYNGTILTEIPNQYDLTTLTDDGENFKTLIPAGIGFVMPAGGRSPIHTVTRGGLTSISGTDITTGQLISRMDLEIGAMVEEGHEYMVGLISDTKLGSFDK